MVAQILLQPVSGRNTSIITRRQSQPGSSQYNSRNPYSPSGRSCWRVTVTDLVSCAPSSGNLSMNGIIGMRPSPDSLHGGVNVIVLDFCGLLGSRGGLDKSRRIVYFMVDECEIGCSRQ